MNKFYPFHLLTCCLIVFAMSACSSEQQQTPQQAPAYKIMELNTDTVTVYSEFSTIIQSQDVIEIRPRITGYLDEIAKKEGSPVKKGELLFRIADADYKQQVRSAEAGVQVAEAKLANAQLEVEKLTPLVEKGIISQYQLQSAQSALDAAKASLAQAQAQYQNAVINLGYTSIVSPVDGVLGIIPFRVGSLVSPTSAEALTTVSGTGDIYAYFSVNEKILSQLRNAADAIKEENKKQGYIELRLANGHIYSQKGKIENASGIIDRSTGSIQMKVIFPNPDMEILSGSSGVLRFPITHAESILIPQRSTYELQDKIIVYTVDSNNTVHSQSINVVGKTEQEYVVSGMEGGTKIVVEGIDKLRDGQTITPKN